jgi:HK97 family phage major capsid protein
MQSMPLPETGMTVNISRITTGTSAASQASENAAVSETNADDTLLTVNVNTIAGQQTVSRQAVERGEMVEEVLLADLANAHNTELDRQVINGSGASGQHLGILGTSGTITITYTDATPTAGELWPKLVDSVRQVGAQRFASADLLVMSPLTWGWLLSSLDTTGRPLFAVGGSEGQFTTQGASDNAGYDMRGTMLGCRVVVSGNVPTNLGGGSNETRVIAMRGADSFLWEDANAPIYIRAEQPAAASLGVLFVVYSYSAFTAGRQPKSVAFVQGTGLILPAAL